MTTPLSQALAAALRDSDTDELQMLLDEADETATLRDLFPSSLTSLLSVVPEEPQLWVPFYVQLLARPGHIRLADGLCLHAVGVYVRQQQSNNNDDDTLTMVLSHLARAPLHREFWTSWNDDAIEAYWAALCSSSSFVMDTPVFGLLPPDLPLPRKQSLLLAMLQALYPLLMDVGTVHMASKHWKTLWGAVVPDAVVQTPAKATATSTFTPRSTTKTPTSAAPKLKATPQQSPNNNNKPTHPILTTLLGSLHRMLTDKNLEKTALREVIVPLALDCCQPVQHALADFGILMTRSKIAVHRLVACDLLAGLLEKVCWEERLWKALEGRLKDVSASIRAAAANALGTLCQSPHTYVQMGVKELLDVELLRLVAVEDDKATVRRAALVAWTNAQWLLEQHVDDNLSDLALLCRDVSVLTRKAAAESWTRLLPLCGPQGRHGWVQLVLPMDGPWAKHILWEPLLNDEPQVWEYLAYATSLRDSLRHFATTPALVRSIVRTLEGHPTSLGAWRVWEAVAHLPNKLLCNLDLSSLLQCPTEPKCVRLYLQVVAQLVPLLGDVSELKVSFLDKLLQLDYGVDLLGPAVQALAAATSSSEDKDWMYALYDVSEQVLQRRLQGERVPDDLVSKALLTVGEVAAIGFSPEDDDASPLSSHDSVGLDAWKGTKVLPSAHLTDMVRAFLAKELPCRQENAEPVRAIAIVAIGKVSMRDAKIAQSMVNVLARELHENLSGTNPSVQNNALLVLGDLCVRYTNMVDRFLPVMAACLQAGVSTSSSSILAPEKKSAIVRNHAILTLSKLLSQDYIKWRGLLFHRFLVATVDENDKVAHNALRHLAGPLLQKTPNLFVNNFVESIFVFNRCTAHPIYVAAASAGDGGSGIAVGFEGIDLSGEAGQLRRMQMYETMLLRMKDEDKISITGRIGKDILSNSLVEGSDLYKICTCSEEWKESNPEAYESALAVITDSFSILSSPLMKVGKASSSTTQEDELEMASTNAARTVVVKGKLISAISRAQLIDNLLPVLTQMKALLQKHRSSLLREVMEYMVHIYRQYKPEVKEFLASNRGLLQEVEYDAAQKASRTILASPIAAA